MSPNNPHNLSPEELERRRKANRRVGLILGAIAALLCVYTFFYLPAVLNGGAKP